MMKLNKELFEILLVEDNIGDVRLLQEAMKISLVKYNLNVANDGEEALLYLSKNKKYENKPRPDFIILDLNLPKKNGYEVLQTIKNDRLLRQIPVMVFTSSESEDDIFKAYDAHANCFVTKPVDFDQLINVVKKIEEFWITFVKLPKEV